MLVNWLKCHSKLQHLFCGALYNQWKSKNRAVHWLIPNARDIGQTIETEPKSWQFIWTRTATIKWKSTLCSVLFRANRGHLWKGKHYKNCQEKNWSKQQYWKFCIKIKFQSAMILPSLTSYRSLSHYMLSNWSLKFKYYFIGPLCSKW